MSSPTPPMPYAIDTSSFMDWHDRYYPTDVFPGLVMRMDALIAQNRLLTADMVREEIEAMGSAGLQAWAKSRKTVFDPTGRHLAHTLTIQGAYPGLRDPKARFDEADAYVIAVAQMTGGIVVTQETEAAMKKNPKRTHFIPDVCRALGIPCINILGMMRREGWTL